MDTSTGELKETTQVDDSPFGFITSTKKTEVPSAEDVEKGRRTFVAWFEESGPLHGYLKYCKTCGRQDTAMIWIIFLFALGSTLLVRLYYELEKRLLG